METSAGDPRVQRLAAIINKVVDPPEEMDSYAKHLTADDPITPEEEAAAKAKERQFMKDFD
eukprot:2246979-Alexandrium_andersonii.AAC.1